MNNQPLSAIIILNWKQSDLTLKCLESVLRLEYPAERLQVVVVDNASWDGSVKTVRTAYPFLKVIENAENLGYAGGNNVGIRWALEAGAEFILVLNNDATVELKMVKSLVAAMVADPQIAIAGPIVYHAAEPEVIQSAGGTLDRNWRAVHIGENQLDIGQYSRLRQVDWLSGCALLVRSEAIRQVGLLDEDFFSYVEDLDWCMRMQAAGWKIIHDPRAKLWHKGVQPNYQPKPYVTYYMTRNQLLLLKKHNAPMRAWYRALKDDLRILLSWTLKSKWKVMKVHRDALWRGMMDFLSQRWGKIEI